MQISLDKPTMVAIEDLTEGILDLVKAIDDLVSKMAPTPPPTARGILDGSPIGEFLQKETSK